ncbi:MAG: O-antigen ligase family protein [candidate division Zixibacteria bacterium]|nr:O-antigen ligase family protein [candidate division Zixibacteria bacterium]
MRTLTINNTGKEKIFLLFVLLEFLAIICSFLLSYMVVLVLVLAGALFLLSFWDIRINLFLAVVFSILIQYGAKEKTYIEMSILTLILIFFLLVIYAKSCLEGLKIKRSKLDLPLILLISISLLTAFRGIVIRGVGLYNVALVGEELYAPLGFGIIFLVINFCDSVTIIRKFFYILVLIAFYFAFMGLTAYFKVGHRIGGYLFGGFPGIIALVLLNLSFYSQKRKSKFLYLMISIPLILHLICSFTRGMWFGFLGGLVISYAFFVWQDESSRAKKIPAFIKGVFLIAIVSCIIFIGVSLFLPVENFSASVSKRFESSFRVQPFSSGLLRLVEYKASLEKIKESPFFGHGFGYILKYRPPWSSEIRSQWYIHQSYIYIVLKMGLFGLIAFSWLFYVFFKDSIRSCRKIQDRFFKGLTFGFIGNVFQALISGLTNYDFAVVSCTFYLAFAMGAVIVIGQKLSNHPEYIKN